MTAQESRTTVIALAIIGSVLPQYGSEFDSCKATQQGRSTRFAQHNLVTTLLDEHLLTRCDVQSVPNLLRDHHLAFGADGIAHEPQNISHTREYDSPRQLRPSIAPTCG